MSTFNFRLGGNFSNKIVDDFDFLNFLPIDLLNLANHDFLDKTVQYNFVQLLDGGILADFLDKGMNIAFLFIRLVQKKIQFA